mmetsp:Transcript_8891/g.29728  ORF Transcript_8891/g.29728 Transcript_8891/m.29728 type:complete len:95 (-) Transcript_8891:1459-1743(-)
MGAEVSMCDNGCMQPVKVGRQISERSIVPESELRVVNSRVFDVKSKQADEREKKHLEEKYLLIKQEISECEKVLARVRGVSLSRSSESMSFFFS